MSRTQAARVAGEPAAMSEAGLKRPVLLVGFLVITALAAISEIICAVMVFTGGAQLAENNLLEVLNEHPEDFDIPPGMSVGMLEQLSGPLWTEMVGDHAASLAARAGMAVFFGAWLLLAVLFGRNAARTARAFITAGALFGLLPHMLFLVDYPPANVMMLSAACITLSILAIVLCWLPPNNNFAKAHRRSR